MAEEFGRRHRTMKRALLAVACMFGVAAIGIAALPGWWPFLPFTAAVFLLVTFYRANSRYRCPACGAKPVDEEGDETWTPPATCVKCGARLTASRP